MYIRYVKIGDIHQLFSYDGIESRFEYADRCPYLNNIIREVRMYFSSRDYYYTVEDVQYARLFVMLHYGRGSLHISEEGERPSGWLGGWPFRRAVEAQLWGSTCSCVCSARGSPPHCIVIT